MISTTKDPYGGIVDDLSYTYEGVFPPESIAAAVTAARDLLEPTATVRLPTHPRRPASHGTADGGPPSPNTCRVIGCTSGPPARHPPPK
jgi:hypothetical protein